MAFWKGGLEQGKGNQELTMLDIVFSQDSPSEITEYLGQDVENASGPVGLRRIGAFLDSGGDTAERASHLAPMALF